MSERSHQNVETTSFSLEGLPSHMGEAGLKLTTKHTLTRHELASGNLGLSEKDLATYASALREEGRFNKVGDYQAVLMANKDAADKGNKEAQQAIADAWEAYRERSTSSLKVGIRNPEFDPEKGEISVDVIPVPFQAYRLFSTANANEALINRAEAAAVAMAVITSDKRLIVQHRAIGMSRILHDGMSRNNATFADLPGASAAGMLDAKRGPGTKPGTIDAITNEAVSHGILKEVVEELGVHVEGKIVGLVHDKLKPHHEVILYSETPLTAKELYAQSRETGRNRKLSEFDFEEKFFDIPANPEAILSLISEVKCPLPPTHAATFVAAGYTLALQERGLEAAQAWKDTAERAINENVQEIDSLVQQYYEQYPDAADIVPERYWNGHVPPRNLEGYSPNYGPEEQGLPKLEDELVRVGLVEEKREVVNHIYSIDLDGVITDPQAKRVIYPELLDEIIVRLNNKQPVALNTGRSVNWAFNNVASAILERVDDVSVLKYLVVSGEKGNTWTTFDELGRAHNGKTKGAVIDPELQAEIDTLAAEYADIMGNHDPKTTMASIEMNDGMNIAEYQEKRKGFVERLKELVANHPKGKGLNVDATTIAVDVEDPYAGKALGAARFLQALDEMDIAYSNAQFTALGDSASDFDMAKEFARHGAKGEFVYVGEKPPIAENGYRDIPILHYPGYSSGTLKYFSQT